MIQPLRTIYVRASALDARRGWLRAGDLVVPCALGSGGIRSGKREGDGATPRSILPMRRVWWRADKVARPATSLSVRRTHRDDLWCDAPLHRRYNRPVKAPFEASHEKMWREDDLYDAVVELGWNDRPPKAGRGSAIFMHVARPGFRPTEGCVALRKRDLVRVLARLGPRTKLVIA
ncbi:L,D-transpeptidase family protein [Terrihabitans sp. B22-R8]|uniref:L,D-transpeptidase family protein n=1 Tax=Terrihabitans sp. B22-R8 TaxID=3425128 RepID=UPI00403C33AA